MCVFLNEVEIRRQFAIEKFLKTEMETFTKVVCKGTMYFRMTQAFCAENKDDSIFF